jgi:primosomal protein N' (replication factor Y)
VKKISVALPGPWWNAFTYLAPQKYPEGVRVRVPVGNGGRIGLVLEELAEDYEGELREISAVIDSAPILPAFMMPLIRWFSETYLCGTGAAMKTLLPANFLKGYELDAIISRNPSEGGGNAANLPDRFLYEPRDSVRFERYAEMLSDGRPSLICFPLYDAAKAFAGIMGGGAFLYPRSGAKGEWRAWNSLFSGGAGSILIGGQTAASSPMPGLARIIIEDESNNVWRTLRPPIYNVRSLLAKRARIEGAELVLGGRMPSARAYRMLTSAQRETPRRGGKNFLFVDLKLAYSPSVKGVEDTLAVSEPLVRETDAAISEGSWAIWILDRKGYAGEIVCEECGSSPRCLKCGGAMRWEASADRIVCVACRSPERVPTSCPRCSGRLLTAKRPGLEALGPLAKSALSSSVPILTVTGGGTDTLAAALKSKSGLVIGTRAALSLCDLTNVGLVGWIDADGEARSQEYDARSRAFGLVWESRWRGMMENSGERRVLLQTRRPAKDWQRGLAADRPGRPGWALFWHDELRERRDFSMPPFVSLVKIDAVAGDIRFLTERFDDAGFEYWLSDSGDSQSGSFPPETESISCRSKTQSKTPKATIWLRTNRLSALRAALYPFFGIQRAKRGYPSVTVRHE